MVILSSRCDDNDNSSCHTARPATVILHFHLVRSDIKEDAAMIKDTPTTAL